MSISAHTCEHTLPSLKSIRNGVQQQFPWPGFALDEYEEENGYLSTEPHCERARARQESIECGVGEQSVLITEYGRLTRLPTLRLLTQLTVFAY